MRALLTTQPGRGHAGALLPLAHALQRAGHQLAFASSRAFASDIADLGFEALQAGVDWRLADLHETFPGAPKGQAKRMDWMVHEVFAHAAAQPFARDLLGVIQRWRPDLVVHEELEFGGYLAAQASGLPHVMVDWGLATAIYAQRRSIAQALAPGRRRLGLPPDPDGATLFADLVVLQAPPEYVGGHGEAPPGAVACRPDPAAGDSAALPAWAQRLPDRPTVLASLGTTFNRRPEVFEAILEALGDEPINLIAAVGADQDPARFGPRPANVRVERFVPQTLLLDRCDAFVTHGGFNSVRDGLLAGVPMLVVPLGAEQPFHAQRCVELGVGRSLARDQRRAQDFRAGVRALLEQRAYRDSAHELRRRFLRLPTATEVLPRLQALTAQAQELVGEPPASPG